jgi:alcohol dehydrogenase class IV
MTSGRFVFDTVPHIVCEDGAVERLGVHARDVGMTHALLVTDRGLEAARIVALALASLSAAQVACTVYADVLGDPPESCVRDAVQLARDGQIDGVIGLGGGSSLDVAKLVALLSRSDAPLESTYGVEQASGTRWPLIQVPTTAGTGSEVTPIAIVTTPTGAKQGVVSRLLYADVAILDATLTRGLPMRVTAMTGIDAMVHAIEAYTSRHKKNAFSDALAIRALQLLTANLRVVLADGDNLDARRAMLTGSMLAGMAFANAPVAAVHALAYPLGGRFHVPHGLSNALVVLPVLGFNLPAAESLYGELAVAMGASSVGACATGQQLIDAVALLLADIGLERTLRAVGVCETDLPMLATEAMAVQRLLVNNPREVRYEDALAIYTQVL